MRLLATAAVVAVATSGCSSPRHEAPDPPPITASAPTPAPVLEPSPTPAGLSETERAAELERVGERPLPVKSVATPAPAPAGDPGVPPPAAIPDLDKLPPAPTPDPLRAMEDGQARKRDYERTLQRLTAELDDARALVARRERDLLAFKNPFLPRPQLPPDEAQAITGLDGAERVKWAEARLVEAKVALDTLQKRYDDTKANPPLN